MEEFVPEVDAKSLLSMFAELGANRNKSSWLKGTYGADRM